MNVMPLGNDVLVELYDCGAEIGGVIIPDTAKEKPRRGIVVSVGSGLISKSGSTIPFDVAVGEEVLIERGAGVDVCLGSKKCCVVRQSEILGVF